MLVSIHTFALRHTPESTHSHFDGTWDELLALVTENFGNQKPGYRDGVVLIPVPADRFHSSTVEIQVGLPLRSSFESRGPNEEMVINTYAVGNKQPAKFVNIVLYSADVLAEDNDRTSEADWEVISINASMVDDEPMHPITMARNMLHKAGGTKATYTAEQLVESIWFWAQHAKVMPA